MSLLLWTWTAVAAPLDLGRGAVEAPGCTAEWRHATDSTMGTVRCGAEERRFDVGQMSGTHVAASTLGDCSWSETRALGGGRTRRACVRTGAQGDELVITVTGLRGGSALPANFHGDGADPEARARLLAIADSYTPTGLEPVILRLPRSFDVQTGSVEAQLRLGSDGDSRLLQATPGLQLGVAILWYQDDRQTPTLQTAVGGLDPLGAWGPEALPDAPSWRAELVAFETAVPFGERWNYVGPGYRELWRGEVRAR